MKTPKAPSVGGTVAASGAANRDTAISQQLLNMTNQVTPYGNLNYAQSGTGSHQTEVLDANGKPTGQFQTIKTPTFTATTTLSPEQQGLLNQEQQFDKRFNEIGLQQTDAIGDHLATPFNLDNSAVEGRIGELARSRLDPMWNERENTFTQKMANQGVAPGSEAYGNARRTFDTGRNDAYNSMFLDARGQAMNELLTGRNQPINEITALMSGGQVQQPTFQNTPQAGVQGVDVAGLTQATYAQKMAQQNAMMGGLAGIGGAALGGWALSERKTKTGIKKVGSVEGLPLYKFRYKSEFGGGLQHLGMMANEVQEKIPDAVAEIEPGIRAVNYSRVAEALME